MEKKTYKIREKNSGRIIASNMKLATSFFDRLRGLMFRSEMPDCDAFLINDCISIHTCFMKFEMDAIFVNDKGKIIKIIRRMKPWRFSLFYYRAARVIEMDGGKFPDDLHEGQELEFVCLS